MLSPLSIRKITLKPLKQPTRKTQRRIARQMKAVKIFHRPTVGPLRPIVHGQTLKYNMKLGTGRGFSLEELKEAVVLEGAAPFVNQQRPNEINEHIYEFLKKF